MGLFTKKTPAGRRVSKAKMARYTPPARTPLQVNRRERARARENWTGGRADRRAARRGSWLGDERAKRWFG